MNPVKVCQPRVRVVLLKKKKLIIRTNSFVLIMQYREIIIVVVVVYIYMLHEFWELYKLLKTFKDEEAT